MATDMFSIITSILHHKLHKVRKGAFALVCAVALLVPVHASAISTIRDAEIENMLREYSNPVFEAAGLQPEAVKIHIVNDRRVNAFVANGQQIYLFAGLFDQMKTPEMILGIIAHETGHLAGGHLPKTSDALERAQVPIILSTLLGIGAVAAGAGDVGAAIIAAGQTVGERSFLSYSRAQEASADQAALSYLEISGESARGLLDVFQLFGAEERAAGASQRDSYASSHPLSYERFSALEDRARRSPYYDKTSEERQYQYDLVRAKLRGFLDDPLVTMRRYPEYDQSDPALYSRSVAYYQQGDTQRAVEEVGVLISRHPDNPYFHELRGQILLEGGKIAEAVDAYDKAIELAPDESLILTALGSALVAQEGTDENRRAISILQRAVELDEENPFAMRQLALAYARDGRLGFAELTSAERAFLLGDIKQAKLHVQRAMSRLEERSPAWQRARDIKQQVAALEAKAAEESRRRGRRTP